MKEQAPDYRLKPILQTIAQAETAVGMETLVAKNPDGASRATLQRRIQELLEMGYVERQGRARAVRYLLTPAGRNALQGETPVPKTPVNYAQLAPPPNPVWQDDIEEFPPVWKLREATDEQLRRMTLLRRTTQVLREPTPGESSTDALPEEDPAEAAERELLRRAINRPLSQRPRVHYVRGFLEHYSPNLTYYLPESLREELRKVGQSDQMARLPMGTYVRSVFNRVLIDLSWNSCRLEGNTFSLLETDRLLAMGRSEDPTRALEARMILNHKEAIEFLVDAPEEIGFNRYTILNLHALLSHELLAESYDEGRLRRVPVGIGGSAYLPLDIPQQIEECFMLFLEKASAIQDPLEQSFFAMVHLPYLQPFVDVNKRVSRLAANIPLIRENLAPLTFVDMPARDYTEAVLAVYELNRVELLRDVFARAYRASAGRYGEVRRGLKPPDPLSLEYHEALRGVAREVVQGLMGKAAAAEHIRRWAMNHVRVADRSRVVEMAERGLLSLHEGNFAKYRLRPSEFMTWQKIWQSET